MSLVVLNVNLNLRHSIVFQLSQFLKNSRKHVSKSYLHQLLSRHKCTVVLDDDVMQQ